MLINERDTEIMVLKEMVRSTKSMVRAKEVDLQRTKKKLRIAFEGARPEDTYNTRKRHQKFTITSSKRGLRPQSILRTSMAKKYENADQGLGEEKKKVVTYNQTLRDQHADIYENEVPLSINSRFPA